MYFQQFSLTLLLFMSFASVVLSGICPKHMKLSTCYSTCPERCDNSLNNGKKCRVKCHKLKCVCKKGYVLKNKYECVKKRKCPQNTTTTTTTFTSTTASPRTTPACPPNSYYTRCISRCQKTCNDPENLFKLCTRECVGQGCVCREPYVLNDKKECVLYKDCNKKPETMPTTTEPDQTCPANMVFTTCLSACPARCSDDPTKPKICTLNCLGQGCECKEDFVLDDNNNCVERSQCKNDTSIPPTTRRFILHYIKKTISSFLLYIF
uniref:TIL domain-containing protein n=1 Tax=Strongyloides stercoralis TaxID=6248 RepID=A0A0K0DZT4_STRER